MLFFKSDKKASESKTLTESEMSSMINEQLDYNNKVGRVVERIKLLQIPDALKVATESNLSERQRIDAAWIGMEWLLKRKENNYIAYVAEVAKTLLPEKEIGVFLDKHKRWISGGAWKLYNVRGEGARIEDSLESACKVAFIFNTDLRLRYYVLTDYIVLNDIKKVTDLASKYLSREERIRLKGIIGGKMFKMARDAVTKGQVVDATNFAKTFEFNEAELKGVLDASFDKVKKHLRDEKND